MTNKNYYGKIDFYSMTGKVMETLYYESEEEYRKEIEESIYIGRPIDPQRLAPNQCIEDDFEDEMER
jgi:hypothetical protein